MNFEQIFSDPMLTETLEATVLGGAIGALIAASIVLALVLLAGLYIYTSLALMTIARKLKHKHAWLAWIPIVNIALILNLGKFHWAWVFLMAIPFLGWLAIFVLVIIATWRIYEARKYPGALALIPIASFIPAIGWLASIANLVIIGFVAWKDR